jgi:bifunctional non-homologous end joining protein LigD
VKKEAATTWVKPRLVAEVRFTDWTGDGEMRHPAFLGLRNDKKPRDVVLEKEQQGPSSRTRRSNRVSMHR